MSELLPKIVTLQDVFRKAIEMDGASAIYFNDANNALDPSGDSTHKHLGKQALQAALESLNVDNMLKGELSDQINTL